MKKTTSYLQRQQDDFERKAYAYGLEPAICTLLAEIFYQKIHEAWQNGRYFGWRQAVGRPKAEILPA